jgi:uncharacterized BrkB/YihY/UPF0761 family membrane protein
MALLLWANLTGIALFLGVAFTAQLEARRVEESGPTVPEQQPSHKRTGHHHQPQLTAPAGV